jgi:hypothetical protein
VIGLLPAMGAGYVPSLLRFVLLAGYADMCPSDLPTLFFLPNTTRASGSLLILQLVSDRLAANHMLLVMCPQCADVLLLPGYASMCPPDLPSLFSFALPHACIWIPLDFAAGK